MLAAATPQQSPDSAAAQDQKLVRTDDVTHEAEARRATAALPAARPPLEGRTATRPALLVRPSAHHATLG